MKEKWGPHSGSLPSEGQGNYRQPPSAEERALTQPEGNPGFRRSYGKLGHRRTAKDYLRKTAIWTACLIVAAMGLMAWPFSKRRKDFDPHSVRKILVIRLDLLGDLVLSMPAVEAVRAAYPEATISMLVLPYTAPLLTHYPFLDKVYTFDVNRLRPSGEMIKLAPYRDLWGVLKSLRSERYDLALSLHGIWASMFAFASGSPFRAGYRDESCPFMLNLAIAGERYQVRRHEADYCLDLARSVGAKTQGYTLRLSPLPEADAVLTSHLEQYGIRDAGSLVAVHVGATNGAAKRWTTKGTAELADRLVGEDGATVVFTGSNGDLPAIGEVTELMTHAPVVLAGLTTIPELVALIARCRLLVSGDSGPMHIAVALGIPVVAIHGPTDPALSGPYGGSAIVVRRDVPCGPCYDLSATADCPLNDPICIKSITVDEVYAAAKKQLGNLKVSC